MFSFFLCIFLEVELLGHMVTLCLLFEELPDFFPKGMNALFYTPVAAHKASRFSTFSSTFVLNLLFIIAILVGVQ